MNYTQSIGNVVELQCISKIIEFGYQCSIPYGNGAKYDFIADINGKLLRIQCKSCKNARGKGYYDEVAICIYTTAQKTNNAEKVAYTKDDIDFLATFWKDTVYLIPIDEIKNRTRFTIRLTPPKNHNKNYNDGANYELKNFIAPSEELTASKEYWNNFRIVEKDDRKCIECGKVIRQDSRSGLCLECSLKKQTKITDINRDKLKREIRSLPFVKVGEIYNVTDNAVRKWCVKFNLPSKKEDIKKYSDEEWEKI